MNPRVLVLAVGFLAAAGLAGCADQNPPPPPPAPAPAAAPAPPPAPMMPANLTPAQQKVAKVQMALNTNGATPPLTVDGKWGPRTAAALKAFQSAHGLKATGTMNGITAKALGL